MCIVKPATKRTGVISYLAETRAVLLATVPEFSLVPWISLDSPALLVERATNYKLLFPFSHVRAIFRPPRLLDPDGASRITSPRISPKYHDGEPARGVLAGDARWGAGREIDRRGARTHLPSQFAVERALLASLVACSREKPSCRMKGNRRYRWLLHSRVPERSAGFRSTPLHRHSRLNVPHRSRVRRRLPSRPLFRSFLFRAVPRHDAHGPRSLFCRLQVVSNLTAEVVARRPVSLPAYPVPYRELHRRGFRMEFVSGFSFREFRRAGRSPCAPRRESPRRRAQRERSCRSRRTDF